ncbi:MAG: type III-B CRISPR module RAMP protein Cmr6, partial [Bacteroidetes bacterium]
MGKSHNQRPRDNYPNMLPLPRNSSSAFNSQKQSPNVGLIFERYTQFQQGWELKDISRNKPGSKQYLLNKLVEVSKQTDDKTREAFVQRWKEMIGSAQSWQMTPVWRFVTGIGNKTALEVGFTFHRVYGFPYIPGSSLKGLARAVALLEITQKAGQKMVGLQEALAALQAKKPTPMQALEIALLEESKKYPNALRSWAGEEYRQVETLVDRFRAVFGTQEQVGQAVFHDAVPAARPTLEVDVMTVHYPDYYQKNKPPADTQNPTPIPFLTVGQTPFWFAVGWHGDSDQ